MLKVSNLMHHWFEAVLLHALSITDYSGYGHMYLFKKTAVNMELVESIVEFALLLDWCL